MGLLVLEEIQFLKEICDVDDGIYDVDVNNEDDGNYILLLYCFILPFIG